MFKLRSTTTSIDKLEKFAIKYKSFNNHVGGHQVVFEACFQNTNEGQMVSYLSDEVSYRLWLQGPLNHLGVKRRTSYITAILHKILEFLHV
jgi:hypothetical protein